mmetsp:Transcript_876/g.1454  ORF Transcript_876/g.1454 Transcript_876/m.1454 type:complete len:180 (-) Transcript_876:158-697(-)|eukprot:CAMPEP_0119328776 /NCGR_PEP_ID=MMETSP1333-20130426/74215_1 /TAXON_ID=418940 /ORGANISM="Scyphosphaera apsteinii, Strain RCC1455" /LENGTH=179 /DNA_ID=CAMNT_0007337735 /DNA_START=109 /DNA_END=648 /DNA_ORIENTATION=+
MAPMRGRGKPPIGTATQQCAISKLQQPDQQHGKEPVDNSKRSSSISVFGEVREHSLREMLLCIAVGAKAAYEAALADAQTDRFSEDDENAKLVAATAVAHCEQVIAICTPNSSDADAASGGTLLCGVQQPLETPPQTNPSRPLVGDELDDMPDWLVAAGSHLKQMKIRQRPKRTPKVSD